MAQGINWDLGSGGFYPQSVQFSHTHLQFYTIKHYRPETNRPKKNTLGCLGRSWQIFHPHCNVIAPSLRRRPGLPAQPQSDVRSPEL